MGRGHRVFIVERNSMTTSEAADKVRAQRIKGSDFWRLGNQEPRKGKGGVFLKGVKLVKLGWVTKKVVARHMTRGATDVESGVKDWLKQRPMSRNLELSGSNRVD
jgi:hypothetical protein